MAEVYRVRLSGPGKFEKQFAIKRILPGSQAEPESVRRFEEEARLNSILTHANIVQVYEFLRAGNSYFLVMEYLQGMDIARLLDAARRAGAGLPIEFCAYIIAETCLGLEYAHRKKDPTMGKALHIVHRDISPQNVMVTEEGAVKVLDFGIAKGNFRTQKTMTGMIRGKAAYMSPEQANGLPLTHQTDIFSLSLVLFEMLTGTRPYSAETDLEEFKLAKRAILPRPSAVNPSIPERLEQILLKGLAVDPMERYQHAASMHQALTGFLVSFRPGFSQKDSSAIVRSLSSGEARGKSAEQSEVFPLSSHEEELLLGGVAAIERAFGGGASDVASPPEPEPPPLKAVVKPTPVKPRRAAPVREQSPPSPPVVHGAGHHFGMALAIVVVVLGAAAGYFLLSLPEVSRRIARVASSTPVPLPTETPEPSPTSEPTVSPTKAPLAPESQAGEEYDRWTVELSKSDERQAVLARKYFEKGMGALKEGDSDEALDGFKKSRMAFVRFLPAWFHELALLQDMKRTAEAKETAMLLLRLRPDLKDLPALKQYSR